MENPQLQGSRESLNSEEDCQLSPPVNVVDEADPRLGRVLIVSLILNFSIYVSLSMVATIFPDYAKSWDLGPGVIGVVMAAYPIGNVTSAHCSLTARSLSTHCPLTVHSLLTHFSQTAHSLSAHNGGSKAQSCSPRCPDGSAAGLGASKPSFTGCFS